MSNKKHDKTIQKIIRDPFKGKSGFMPDKIKTTVNVRVGLNENLAFPEGLMRKLLLEVAQEIDPRIYPEDYCDSLALLLAEENNLAQEQIIIANGGDKIIDLAVRLTIQAGDTAVIVQPTYPMYEHAIRVQGGEIKELFLTGQPSFELEPDNILPNIDSNKDKLLFLCSPNNPTGNQFSKEKLIQIIDNFPGIVALDETYSRFGDYSMSNELDNHPNLLLLNSLSKFYGLAGMRIGFAMAHKKIISRMKEMLPAFNVNIASLELAKKVILQKKVLTKMFNEILSERKKMYHQMLKMSEIIPYQSMTNFILFQVKSYPADVIQKELLEQEGVLVRNMSNMPLCENTLRFTITTPENNTQFLKSLQKILALLAKDNKNKT
jgi:histidinol-phosphate aminotransferase